MTGQGHRMLLVDDNQETRDLLHQILMLDGWEVVEAATVEEGLAALDPPPDCVLLDLELPDGRGETILRKVRIEQLPTRVVVSTGMQDPARLSEVSYMRPDAVLQKPIDPERLCRACESQDPAEPSRPGQDGLPTRASCSP
jgi:DNA-binding response OmpR family regulator